MEETHDESFHKYVSQLGDIGKNTKGAISIYNEWSEKYDGDLHAQGYIAHESLVDLFLKVIGSTLTAECKVLDICAGTGWVGEYLRHRGFKGQIDAQDGSPKMLEVAKAKEGVYSRVYCHMIEADTHMPPELSKGDYDAIIACGCFWPGRVDSMSLKHCVNTVRVGGLILFELRRIISKEVFDFNMEFEKEIFRLENMGIWKLVDVYYNSKFKNVDDETEKDAVFGSMQYCFEKLSEYTG